MKYVISSRFCQQENFRSAPHNGIDFVMPKDTPIYSIENGVVEKIVNYGNENLGKGIFVKWENGKTAIYGHLNKIAVEKGDVITKGELLGYSGNTGNVVGENGGYHLHFAIKDGFQFIDPSPYIDAIQNMGNIATKVAENIDVIELNLKLFNKVLNTIDFNIILTLVDLFNNSQFS